jgi:hypothetical protein
MKLRKWVWMRSGAAATLAAATILVVPCARNAHADGDDRAVAQALVTQLERLEHDGTRGRITTEALTHATEALERATRLRRAGDEAHAKAAEGLAREWAETGRDLVRAADAESTAADLRRKAMSEQEQVERSRALVEDGVARVGRLRAQIEEANAANVGARRAVEVHGGQPKPPTKPQKTDTPENAPATTPPGGGKR